jgi:hypothetical protein
MGANQSFNLGNFGDYAGYSSGFQFDPEKQKAFSGMWSKLGKENESSSFDKDSKPDWSKALNLATSYLGKAREKGEQDDFMSKVPRALGSGTGGFGGQVLDNLGVVFPPQQAPIYIPGVQSGGGGKSAGQRIAGGIGGAFQGFLAGAATGMPHMAGIGAVTGALGGALG